MNTNKVWQLHKWLLSSHAQTRLARPQMRMAQDIADDLSFFEQQLHPFAYVLLLQNWVWSYYMYAVLKIRNNTKIVCHEQTVMTRVASDIQSSSRRNSSGHWLVLKPLIPRSKWLGQLTLKYAGKCSEIWVKNSEKNFPQLDCTLGYSMARISCLDDAFSEGNSTTRITKE